MRTPSRPALPDPHRSIVTLGVARTAIATGILVAPVLSARALGADTGTATRVGWLTRMMAVRDGALGVGTVLDARSGSRLWLLGGGVSDAVDAAVLAGALGQGRVRGVVPRLVVVGATGSAVAHVATALRRTKPRGAGRLARLTRRG